MPFEIIPHGTHIDFIGKRRIAFAMSGLLVLLSLAAIPVRGFKMGIDFAGGTEVQLLFAKGVAADEGKIRAVADACGVPDVSVVRYGETTASEFLVRFRSVHGPVPEKAGSCPLPEGEAARLAKVIKNTGADTESPGTAALIDRLVASLSFKVGQLQVERVEYVGPRVGDELRRDGLLSIGVACLLILIYIAFRFSSRFAPGAVIALVHDIVITGGVFVIFHLEFDLRVLAALLATLGYSLNDTIIIYDRIRENMDVRTKHDLPEVLNLSVNQTLSRTLLTSLTTFAAVLALLLVGGEVIRPFALAMAIGVVVGTYSSIYIASPTLLFLENRLERRQQAAGARGKEPAAGGKGGKPPPAGGKGGKPPPAGGKEGKPPPAGGKGGKPRPAGKRRSGKSRGKKAARG